MTSSLVPANAHGFELAREAAREGHALLFNDAQLALLRTSFGSPLTDHELAYFVQVCKRTGLDPFRKQIYAVKRRPFEGAEPRLTIQTGIDGFRAIAERSGAYEGQTPAAWCGEDGVWKDVWLANVPPAAARVGVHRRGFKEPLVAVARFSGYTAGGNMWKKMPDVMLAKCAEALALRKAFPEDLGGLYTRDEMDQAEREQTSEEGRAVAGKHGAFGQTQPVISRPAEAPKEPGTSPPHDPETGEVRGTIEDEERMPPLKGPSPAQSARMLSRERELIACGTPQALAAVWRAINGDRKTGALTLTQAAELGNVKDRCKKNLDDAITAELERSNDVGDQDPGGLGPEV